MISVKREGGVQIQTSQACVDGMVKIWAQCKVRGEGDKCRKNFVDIMYEKL